MRRRSSTTFMAILLMAVLAMATFSPAATAAADEHVTVGEESKAYFKRCCKNCRTFSGVMVCDDVSRKCHPDCDTCRVVQVRPFKTFRCADAKTDDGTCGKC